MEQKLISETTIQAFLTHVKGKSFVLADVAAALNLDEDTAVSTLIYLINHKMLDVTCTWVPNTRQQNGIKCSHLNTMPSSPCLF